jgi:sugar-specific transcriptional regulator TrmB
MGFSPNEIKVYLALNDHGMSKAGRVAKIAKIDRSSCYNTLKSLQEKGLVGYVLKGNVKFFQATGPRKLMDYIKEQENDLQQVLPELHARHKASKLTGQVRMYKGVKGIRTILQDIVRTKRDNLVFGNEGQLQDRMPEYRGQFLRQLRENKIQLRQIVSEKWAKKTSVPTKTRYVPKGVESPVVTSIYGDKIALMVWTDEPEGIIIENPAAAKAYRSYFEFMWENAKKK